MSYKVFSNTYISKYCDKYLPWFERNFDFYDLNKWEEFDNNKDEYIKNVNIYTFDKIYRYIGFKPLDS